MKFVSTLSPKFQHRSVDSLLYQLSVVSGHAKVNLCIDLGLPVCVVHRLGTRVLYLLQRLFTSAQLLNIYPAVEAEACCESPFSLLQEEVCTLQHFTFHTCNWKRDRKEYITDWVVGCTLEFPPLLECLKGVTTTALELFLTLNILNALPLS